MKSDTDTEVIVQLVELFVKEGLATAEAFRKTLSLITRFLCNCSIRCRRCRNNLRSKK